MESFNNKLRFLRKERNLTQKELGSIIDTTNDVIFFWEKGRAEPSINDICKLAKYFNVSTDYLLGLEDEAGCKINDNEQEYKENFDYFDGTHKIHHTKK